MARPTNANAQATRSRILEVAAQLFSEQGPKASLRTLARSAGVSLATVHHYFGSKEGLHQAVIEETDKAFDELAVELTSVARGGTDLDDIIEQVVRRSYRFARAHEVPVRLSARSAIDRGEIGAERQARVLLPGLELGGALLAQLVGTDAVTLRLIIRSVSYLVVRYALTDPKELAIVLGWDPEDMDEERCEQAIEDHLVFLARALLAGAKGADA